MAEFVQESLEEMIPELEQLIRVQIFTEEEVKAILRSRKRFEYKIQKQTKRKEDFLSYIQYEMSLLSLIRIKREKIGYVHKKDDIDYNVARRINRLFKILEHRFYTDIKIWNSHLEFLKSMKWTSSVGKIYRRLLTVHPSETEAWIAAAKYELEETGIPEIARNIMLEALRFHPRSHELYKEYFRLELIYADTLRKRSSILGGSDETAEGVLNGEIALAVFNQSIQIFDNDPNFCLSLLSTLLSFEENGKHLSFIRTFIINHLKSFYGTHPSTIDGLAREALWFSGVQESLCIYEEGLFNSQEPQNLLPLYLDTLFDLIKKTMTTYSSSSNVSLFITDTLVKKLKWGHEHRFLSIKNYVQWISLLDDYDTRKRILRVAREMYPKSLSLFRNWLNLEIREEALSSIELIAEFFDAIQHLLEIPHETKDDWSLMFTTLGSQNELLDDFYFSALSRKFPVEDILRVLYLQELGSRKDGLTKSRNFYETHRFSTPFHLDFHLKMLEIEEQIEGEKRNDDKIRRIFETATEQFGKNNVDIWASYLNFEMKYGTAVSYASVSFRAEQTLNSELKEKFLLREILV